MIRPGTLEVAGASSIPYLLRHSLDQVEYRHAVAYRRDDRVAVGREQDVALAVHGPAQVCKPERRRRGGHCREYVGSELWTWSRRDCVRFGFGLFS